MLSALFVMVGGLATGAVLLAGLEARRDWMAVRSLPKHDRKRVVARRYIHECVGWAVSVALGISVIWACAGDGPTNSQWEVVATLGTLLLGEKVYTIRRVRQARRQLRREVAWPGR